MPKHSLKTVPHPIQGQSPGELVQRLKDQIARIETDRRPSDRVPISTGCEALDCLLPEWGFRRKTLVEWLGVGEGSGAETLALAAAREACREGGAMVVLDHARQFYPPAAARLGIKLENTIVVRASSEADNTWALDQALRCPGVAAVLAWPNKLSGHTFRRLQLAAEQGNGLGLLIRPEDAHHEPSWADVRLLVEPLPSTAAGGGRRLRVRVLRSRGGIGNRIVEVEIDDETHTVHLASRLARHAANRSAAGA